MSNNRVRSTPVLVLALLLGACTSPAAAPTAAPAIDSAATQTVVAVANSNGVATSVAATLTAQPTSTPLPTNTPLPTATTQPSSTPLPTDTATVAPSATTAPTPTAAATRKPTARPTLPPQPTATQAPVVAASVYSEFSGGPHGYHSLLGCTVPGGAQCQPVMSPGDVAFSIRLESDLDAVLAIFVPFGLSVEKDGVNQADAYMTVVSGWLNPGEYALLGTSHKFSEPGHYVIHTNGCLLTQASYPNCSWGTVDGTVVTFDIQ